ncbi:MAG: TolC family protein [Dysgonamonadaceae bacterium]|nr:TolC family protein [Dysgonamonadaceae bacterium]MDD4246516.1 TolC family protein [Dysgonamonadaceae bacterium]MDD4605537.1 TolC family protein [Dysgonamonadaceae bacterium]
MKRVLSFLGLLLLFYSPTVGQVITLDECVRIGLEQNFDIRIMRNNQQISDRNVSWGNAGLLPTIDATSGYNIKSDNANQTPADGSAATSIRNNNTETLNTSVNLNWTIFDGFNAQTNYKKLKELRNVGELNTRFSIESFIANLSAEYYNLVQETMRMENLKSAVKLSGEQLRIVEARYQIGSFSRLDLQQARVDFNADSSRLIRQYETLNTSRIKLNELMGVNDVETPLIAADTSIILKPLQPKDVLWNKVLSENTLLQLAKKDILLSELNLKNIESNYYPYVRLNTGYGFSHFNYDLGTFDKQRTWGPNVGITIGINIFDGFNKRREQKNARTQIENRKLETEQTQLMLKSNFSNMWQAYRNNLELLNLEKENVENARENYEIAIERYKLGDLAGILLREAQNSLLEAEERLVSAQFNIKLNEIALLQISGMITDYLK